MRLRHFIPILSAVSALSFGAAACSSEAPPTGAVAEATSDAPPRVDTSALPAEATPEASPAALDEPAAPALVADAEKGEKGARNVLLSWARAIENGQFDRAYAQWGDGGARSGMSAGAYAAQFAPYRKITIGVGEGAVEGAAGSLYYEVPVTFTGERKTGAAVERKGTIVVRRVNDVEGATPEQLRWHIESSTLRF